VSVVTTDAYALQATGLTKQYRSVRALDNLDLNVPLGGIHGFLGPNGSGKTTTIRIALGLSLPDSGQLRVLGEDVVTNRVAAVGRVGAIVEEPRFFPSFSGRHNLRLLASSIGTPSTRVDELLELTGLSESARRHYSGYSLGMKQRLAIAATLLKDPALLIFDEPTNGLDPAGIHQIRVTMKTLAQQGRTVLVSSHMLAEVEQLVDTVSIISHGRLVAEGRLHELLGPADHAVIVEVPDPYLAATVLDSAYRVSQSGPNLLEIRPVPSGPPPRAGEINRLLAAQGCYASTLTTKTESLEDAFLRLTESHRAPQAMTRAEGGLR
jgi:ABC-type multidrug transport system ATPase subunit